MPVESYVHSRPSRHHGMWWSEISRVLGQAAPYWPGPLRLPELISAWKPGEYVTPDGPLDERRERRQGDSDLRARPDDGRDNGSQRAVRIPSVGERAGPRYSLDTVHWIRRPYAGRFTWNRASRRPDGASAGPPGLAHRGCRSSAQRERVVDPPGRSHIDRGPLGGSGHAPPTTMGGLKRSG
jgi:hypothetical protein